jgi:hypothetical protein
MNLRRISGDLQDKEPTTKEGIMKRTCLGVMLMAAVLVAQTAGAQTVFSTGDPDGKMAMASRPENGPNIEIEAADDFLFTNPVILTGATFIGLIPPGATVSKVVVEVYREFPKDSDAQRTPQVPTRANSPSDVAFDSRASSDGSLTFTASVLSESFTAANSVLNGIHPGTTPKTGGEGSVTGQEVRFAVAFAPPISLPADHYFFIPQVQLDDGDFFWLSAPKPIFAPGTPFAQDLQAWIRNGDLDPDWLRVGTDIVGAGAFNGAFSLQGHVLASPTSLFNAGDPDGKMAMASRPENGPNIEIEAADDFLLADPVGLTSATFVGLIPSGATVSKVVVEVYRVFSKDSDAQRTPRVPTRANSPSDVAFDSRDSADGSLTFSTSVLNASFTAANSVLNGIHPGLTPKTNGEGPVTGQEVEFTVTFAKPILLPADHYFFIPQVQLDNGNFFWLSAPKPIVAPGTPFTLDLQTWIRNGDLDPDWLRVGTDIVGAGAFNAAFSLQGQVIQAPLELSPAHLAIGLKNSDDQGTQFDLKVELLRNDSPIASGLERCITGATRNPELAKEAIVSFDPFGIPPIASGDVLALRVSARIGTKPDDTKCTAAGGNHDNAVGLRLFYDGTSRRSRFDAAIEGGPEEDLFLHSDGTACGAAQSAAVTTRFLDPNAPTAPQAKCKDSGVLNFRRGNPFSIIGTWSLSPLP